VLITELGYHLFAWLAAVGTGQAKMAMGDDSFGTKSDGVEPMDISAPDITVTPELEEEARQTIEMLRGDDVSARVSAANKLENVATALGVERTRKVSRSIDPLIWIAWHL
jgi:hypothetical protein